MSGSRVFKRILGVFFAISLLALVIFFVVSGLSHSDYRFLKRSVTNIKEWSYTTDNSKHSVLLPGKAVNAGDAITIVSQIPQNTEDSMYLCTAAKENMTILIDGKARYTFRPSEVDIIGGVVKDIYVFCPINKADAGCEVSITVSNMKDKDLGAVYVGDAVGIVEAIVKSEVPITVLILALFLFSLAIVIISVAVKLYGEKNVSIFFLGLGVLLASLWLILKSDLIQFCTNIRFTDGPSSYMLLMLLPYPFIVYLDRMQNFRHIRLQNVLKAVSIFNFIIFSMLHFAGINDFLSTRDIFEAIIAGITLIELVVILRDAAKKEIDNYKIVFFGFLCLILLSIFEIIRINIFGIAGEGILVILGMFILLCLAIWQQIMESSWLQEQISIKTRQLDQMTVYNSELQSKADKDSLTGLYNGAYLKETAARLLDEDANGCYIMIDLDNFKQVNDTYGHIAGDIVLKKLADNISKVFTRQNDIVGRMGGDEFGVFISGLVSRENIVEKLLELKNSYLSEPELIEYSKKLGLSMGIALSPDDSYNIQDLYRQADNALYYAKENNKGGYRFFSDKDDTDKADTNNEKSALMVDMEHIKGIIEGSIEYDSGALSVGYDHFKQIYNYLLRYVKRNDNNIQVLLFTLSSNHGGYPDIVELNIAMSSLNHAVVDTLRRVDVGTSYSSHQYIVILTDTDLANGTMVADRVVKEYRKTTGAKNISISYQIETLGKDENSDKTANGRR